MPPTLRRSAGCMRAAPSDRPGLLAAALHIGILLACVKR